MKAAHAQYDIMSYFAEVPPLYTVYINDLI